MSRVRAIVLLALVVFVSMIVLQSGAFQVTPSPCAVEAAAPAAALPDEIHALDADVRDLLQSLQSTSDRVGALELLANPNRPLTAGDKGQIQSQLDRVNVELSLLEARLYRMKQDESRLSAVLNTADLPAAELSGLQADISRIRNNLDQADNRLYSIRIRLDNINTGRL